MLSARSTIWATTPLTYVYPPAPRRIQTSQYISDVCLIRPKLWFWNCFLGGRLSGPRHQDPGIVRQIYRKRLVDFFFRLLVQDMHKPDGQGQYHCSSQPTISNGSAHGFLNCFLRRNLSMQISHDRRRSVWRESLRWEEDVILETPGNWARGFLFFRYFIFRATWTLVAGEGRGAYPPALRPSAAASVRVVPKNKMTKKQKTAMREALLVKAM